MALDSPTTACPASLSVHARSISLQTLEIRSLLSTSITKLHEERRELLAVVMESRELEKANKELLSSLRGIVENITGDGMLSSHTLELPIVRQQSMQLLSY